MSVMFKPEHTGYVKQSYNIDGLVQEIRNPIANTPEWRLSCTKLSIYSSSRFNCTCRYCGRAIVCVYYTITRVCMAWDHFTISCTSSHTSSHPLLKPRFISTVQQWRKQCAIFRIFLSSTRPFPSPLRFLYKLIDHPWGIDWTHLCQCIYLSIYINNSRGPYSSA